jgi:hypothetical protein
MIDDLRAEDGRQRTEDGKRETGERSEKLEGRKRMMIDDLI